MVPRPIALVTTLGPEGVVNAAPFSFFNAFSEDPAVIALGVQHRPDGTPKDTARNIQTSGEVRGQPGRRGDRRGHERHGHRFPADFAALRPVGRLSGSGYARQRDTFELRRITYAEWRARRANVQP